MRPRGQASAPHRGAGDGVVYLIHFLAPYKHARHYLGWSDDVVVRLAQHRAGRGARLLEVIKAAGIDWTLARTWDGSRGLERRLKRHGGATRCCPLCCPGTRRGTFARGERRAPQ